MGSGINIPIIIRTINGNPFKKPYMILAKTKFLEEHLKVGVSYRII